MPNRKRRGSSQPVSLSRRSPQQFASQLPASQLDDSLQCQDDEPDITEMVNSVVISALHHSASVRPFKKANLLQGCRTKSRQIIAAVLTSAKEKLMSIYGLELVEVSTGKFVVVLPKSAPFRYELASVNESDSPQFVSLLGVVLTLIFLQEGRLSAEYMRKVMLPKLFPDIDTHPHPYFGNVDKMLQEFEQQAYVLRETEMRNGEPKAYLKWGPRAELEFNKKAAILPVLSTMFGGTVPERLMNDLEKCEAVDEPEPNASSSSNN